jgi:hypothetical protein
LVCVWLASRRDLRGCGTAAFCGARDREPGAARRVT